MFDKDQNIVSLNLFINKKKKKHALVQCKQEHHFFQFLIL